MAKRRIMVPARWVRVDNVAGTVAVRGKHGRFHGRKKVEGMGDKTTVRRVKQDVDIDHDGRIDIFGGTIYGRNKRPRVGGRPVVVRASSRAKGYERRL